MNEREFIDLIDANRRLIAKICYMYAKSNEESKDLFQESVLNLWRAVNSFRAESKIETWLYRVTLNSCISYMRTQRRSIPSESILSISENYFQSEENRDFEELHSLIAMLNPLDKAIILLYLEERCYEDIAEITGLSPSNVGVRLNRIRKRLKSIYQNQK